MSTSEQTTFNLGHAFMRHPLHEWAKPKDGPIIHDAFRHQQIAQRLANGFRQTVQAERLDLMEGRFVLHPTREKEEKTW